MRATLTLAAAGVLDFARSRIFAVIIAAGAALVVAALVLEELAASQEGRVLADLGLAFISIVAATVAGIAPLSTVAREIQTRQVHLVLARPVSRTSYVIARLLACTVLIVIVNVILGAILAGLLAVTGGEHVGVVLAAAVFASFEAIIISSFALLFGVRSSVAVSSLLLVLVFVLGRLSGPLDEVITRKLDGSAETLALLLARVLPALDRFDLTPLLHGAPVDALALARSAAYAAFYVAALVALTAWRLQRRDLI